MTPGEYQPGLHRASWKLDRICAINEALGYAGDRESFIASMEQQGCQVVWSDRRKHIIFITPEGYRCRDSSLHSETFQKDNSACAELRNGRLAFNARHHSCYIRIIAL